MNILFYAMVFILGLVIGSYLNVCIYRIPRQISTAAGRSKCTVCDTVIKWYDLIPVLSYLILRGKCRGCGERISPRYMLIELLTGVCFLLAFLLFGMSAATLLAWTMLAILIIIAFIDADHKIIPDRFIITILALGIINVFLSGDDYLSHIIGFFVVSVPFLLIALLTGGMGGGDIKLMAAAGLYLGWAGALLSVIVGSVAGAVYAVFLLATKRAGRKSEVPFGPFLALGIAVAVLFGSRIISYYLSSFLH